MNILLINAKKEFAHSHGKLNETLHQLAFENLSKSHNVKQTTLEDGYDIKEEIEKFLFADIIIYQMPAWWMGPPWTLKKYMDEVFTEGHMTLYKNDGRTRSDLNHKYGSGGLLQGKKYMLSVTWNAPDEAFSEPEQFFEGKGVEAVYFPFHKANQFLGMSPLPTFLATDVMKDPNIDLYCDNYIKHLEKHTK